VAQKPSVSEVHGAQAPGSRLTIRARALGKTNTLEYRVTHLILTGTVRSCILLLIFTRRRRRGKSGKGHLGSTLPFRSAAPFSGGSGKFVPKDGHFV